MHFCVVVYITVELSARLYLVGVQGHHKTEPCAFYRDVGDGNKIVILTRFNSIRLE